MKKLTIITLLLCLTASQLSAEDFTQRRKRSKKEKIEAEAKASLAPPVAKPAPAPKPAPKPTPKPAPKPPRTDITLAMTPQQTDSLVAVWRERQRMESYDQFFSDFVDFDPTTVQSATPDSVYARRLFDLVSPIHLPYNDIVRGYINRYTDSRYTTISRILGMSVYYFPIIEEELLRQGLPVELRALPIIESALSPTAISSMGAAGLWQFMPATGKGYGLEVNSLVDERCDPLLATRAACRYLKDLFNIYKEWTLALAAYNCGPGNVNKAIARSGGVCRNFWDIYDYLPRETRGYVPAFIGASYAYAYHKQHGISMTESPIAIATDTVRINRLMHFSQISSTIDVPIETLRQLNPQYKQDVIPAASKSYTLTLPQRHISQYIAQEQQIIAKDSIYLKEFLNPVALSKKMVEKPVTTHTVKKGETMGGIARKYRVTTTQIMRWNRLKSANSLRVGQKLRIEKR